MLYTIILCHDLVLFVLKKVNKVSHYLKIIKTTQKNRFERSHILTPSSLVTHSNANLFDM